MKTPHQREYISWGLVVDKYKNITCGDG